MVQKGDPQVTGGIDRFPQVLAVGTQMADVVQMVMGDQDSLERIKTEVMLQQYPLEAADADSGIDQQARLPVGQEITVSATSA